MKEETELKIECKICGKKFKRLPNHIWQAHKNEITIEEYYLKFIGEKGKCKECGKDTAFVNLSIGYNSFCSNICLGNNVEVKNKKKETCNKNYKVNNPSQSKEIKVKKKETCIKNHGVDSYSKTEEFKEKYKNTCMKNHNVEYPAQSPEIREKQMATCIKNHGVDNYSKTEEFKEKSKNTFMKNHNVDHPMKNKDIINKAKESTLRNNNGVHPCKLSFAQLQERYPLLIKVEELKEGPNGEILAHCKNSNCKNSKENGGYFEPTLHQLNWRKQGIDKNDTAYLYCCEECKKACPLFGRSASALHNLINENPEIPYTQTEYSTWKNEVFHRQKIENDTDINFCEYCHATEDLHVHHEVPQKLVPGYALDPDNGIIACEKCHYEKGHATGTECSTGNLANKICK